MRITGGKAKGIILESIEADSLRPSTDALRQAVFSSLGPLVEGAQVLDIFAGTGAYGLEALSRGASQASFLEKNRKLQPILKVNALKVSQSAGLEANAYTLVLADAFNWTDRDHPFDLIFIDPPYTLFKTQALDGFLLTVPSYLVKAPQSRLVIEHPGEIQSPELAGLELFKRLGKDKRRQPAASIYRLL